MGSMGHFWYMVNLFYDSSEGQWVQYVTRKVQLPLGGAFIPEAVSLAASIMQQKERPKTLLS